MSEIKYDLELLSDNIQSFSRIEDIVNAFSYHLDYSLLELERNTSPKVMLKLSESVENLKHEINMLHQNSILINNFLKDSEVIIKDIDKKNS